MKTLTFSPGVCEYGTGLFKNGLQNLKIWI